MDNATSIVAILIAILLKGFCFCVCLQVRKRNRKSAGRVLPNGTGQVTTITVVARREPRPADNPVVTPLNVDGPIGQLVPPECDPNSLGPYRSGLLLDPPPPYSLRIESPCSTGADLGNYSRPGQDHSKPPPYKP